MESNAACGRGNGVERLNDKERRLIRWVAEGDWKQADRSLLPDGDGPWQAVIVTADGLGDAKRDRALLLDAVRNALEELLPATGFCYRETVVLIQRAPRTEEESERRRRAAGTAERALACRIGLTPGVPVLRPQQLHRSYLTARETLEYRERERRRTGERENGEETEG